MNGSRGQAMVVWALTLLLLTLMVAGTLSLSNRLRSKVETQVLADTAAYSGAVAVARTFNTSAVLNRAITAHMVALAGVQSEISWAGFRYGVLTTTQTALDTFESQFDTCCTAGCPAAACACAELPKVRQAKANLAAKLGTIAAEWQLMDQNAADQSRRVQGAAGFLCGLQWGMLEDARQYLHTRAIDGLAHLAADPDLSNPLAGVYDQPAMEELDRATGSNEQNGIRATMGARGYDWVTKRVTTDGDFDVVAALGGSDPAYVEIENAIGGSGFGDLSARETSQIKTGTSGRGAWAEDHAGGATQMRWSARCSRLAGPGIFPPVPVTVSDAWVYSTGLADHDDMHVFAGSDDLPPDVRHTYPGDPRLTFGMYPWFLDYNAGVVGDREDLYGQPVLVLGVQRDLRAIGAKPWELLFNFRFTPAGATYDSGRGDFVTYAGTDIGRQMALAGGLVYYHRNIPQDPLLPYLPGWKEPPNMFNPFWRATLYQTGQPATEGPAPYLERAGYPDAAAAFRALRAAGFKGIQ